MRSCGQPRPFWNAHPRSPRGSRPANARKRTFDALPIRCYTGTVSDVTRILDRVQKGDPKAAEELLPLVYDELRKLAAYKMGNEATGHTLQPTALVHEAWLRLGDGSEPKWENRRHFFGAASEAMRRILVDRARRRKVRHEAGIAVAEELNESRFPAESSNDELLKVHEALDDLAKLDPSAAELVKLRYFVGMSMPEASEVIAIPLRSAERLWSFARAWLRKTLTVVP